MSSPPEHPPDVLVDLSKVSHPLSGCATGRGQPASVPVSSAATPSTSSSCTTSTPKFGTSGTSSRQKLYLLDQYPCRDLPSAKLPKNLAVMRCIFDSLLCQEDLIKNNNPVTLATKIAVNNAAKETATAIKRVWRHHFGIRLIDGKETVEGEVDTSRIMIVGEK